MKNQLLLTLYFIFFLSFAGCTNRDIIDEIDISGIDGIDTTSADEMDITSIDEIISHDDNITDNELSEFIKDTSSGILYDAKYSFDEGFETQTLKLTGNKIKDIENGFIYELTINTSEDFFVKRFPIYMYIQSGIAYRIWADLEQIHQMDTETEIITNSTIVYYEETINDELLEEEPGIHHYLIVDKDIKESHYYQLNDYANVVGYYETFRWESGQGLSSYRSGFAAGADALELKRNND